MNRGKREARVLACLSQSGATTAAYIAEWVLGGDCVTGKDIVGVLRSMATRGLIEKADYVAGDPHRPVVVWRLKRPLCLREMGCLCAGHARDWWAEACDTREA